MLSLPISNRQVFIALFSVLVVLHLIASGNILTNDISRHVYFNLHLPELLTAFIVGAGLCAASATFQVLLKNPLADPSILGMSSGASVVAGLLLTTPLAIYASTPGVLLVCCFVGALLSSLLLLRLSERIASGHGQIILAGIALTTLASAILAWIYLVASPTQSKTLTFWLLGSFAQTEWSHVAVVYMIVGVGCYRLWHCIPQLNQLMVGESVAINHGVNVARLRYECVLWGALIVGACVAIAGSIAFVGLLVPHFVRRVTGSDNRKVLPFSMLCGAWFMGLIVLCNLLLSVIALPVSLVTATIGAPLFIYVLLKQRVSQ